MLSHSRRAPLVACALLLGLPGGAALQPLRVGSEVVAEMEGQRRLNDMWAEVDSSLAQFRSADAAKVAVETDSVADRARVAHVRARKEDAAQTRAMKQAFEEIIDDMPTGEELADQEEGEGAVAQQEAAKEEAEDKAVAEAAVDALEEALQRGGDEDAGDDAIDAELSDLAAEFRGEADGESEDDEAAEAQAEAEEMALEGFAADAPSGDEAEEASEAEEAEGASAVLAARDVEVADAEEGAGAAPGEEAEAAGAAVEPEGAAEGEARED